MFQTTEVLDRANISAPPASEVASQHTHPTKADQANIEMIGPMSAPFLMGNWVVAHAPRRSIEFTSGRTTHSKEAFSYTIPIGN